jgi:energy-coupling factor transporter ATP-binding protein EcfA2/ABC-type multidrug transport system permease subunit
MLACVLWDLLRRAARVHDGVLFCRRKRLTIAVELASNAPILFLDEPTSGLDSRAAENVMRVIRNIADTGRTVICTIHQPSSNLFYMFDDLILLQKGGWQVYLGPMGQQGKAVIKYLEGVNGFEPLKRGENPSSWMLGQLGRVTKATSSDTSTTSPDTSATTDVQEAASSSSSMRGSVLSDTLHASSTWQEATHILHTTNAPCANHDNALSTTILLVRPFFGQFWILFKRFWKSYTRDFRLNGSRISALIFLNVTHGVAYYGIAHSVDDLSGVRSLIACIFMTASFMALTSMNVLVPASIQHRPVLYRELASRMYHPSAHSLASFLVELPWLAFMISISMPICYFMAGLSPAADTVLFHLVAVFFLVLVYASLGEAIATAMPSFEVAQASLAVLGPLYFLFGGLWSPPAQMADGTRWLCWLDPVFYAFRAIVPPHFYCAGTNCPRILVISMSSIYYSTTYAYIRDTYDMYFEARWYNVGMLVLFVLAFQAIAFLATRYLRHIKR